MIGGRQGTCREWLIDEVGRVWPAGAPALRKYIGSDLPWKFLAGYAIDNLGYCSVRSRSTSAQISIRPQIITQATLAAAIYWLFEQRAERIAISMSHGRWTHQLFTSKWSALTALTSEADAQLQARGADFFNRRRPLDNVTLFPPLAALLRWAGERNCVYAREGLYRLIDGPLGRRALVLGLNHEATRLTIREWGSGYRTYSRAWLDRAKGLNVEDQRDFSFASKAAVSYRLAWTARQALLEDVDARVLDEEGKLNPVRYTRIIIPMRDAAGRPVLVGASVVNPAVKPSLEFVKEP